MNEANSEEGRKGAEGERGVEGHITNMNKYPKKQTPKKQTRKKGISDEDLT